MSISERNGYSQTDEKMSLVATKVTQGLRNNERSTVTFKLLTPLTKGRYASSIKEDL